MLWKDTDVPEVHTASIFTSSWYPTTTLHGFTTQMNSTRIFTAVKNSNLASGNTDVDGIW